MQSPGEKKMKLVLEKIGSSKPWVARITGTDAKFGFCREFVDGIADYSRSNRPRTRGVYYHFELSDGVYEVKGGTSWGSAEKRCFVRVVGETRETVTMQDVREAISAVGGA